MLNRRSFFGLLAAPFALACGGFHGRAAAPAIGRTITPIRFDGTGDSIALRVVKWEVEHRRDPITGATIAYVVITYAGGTGPVNLNRMPALGSPYPGPRA